MIDTTHTPFVGSEEKWKETESRAVKRGPVKATKMSAKRSALADDQEAWERNPS